MVILGREPLANGLDAKRYLSTSPGTPVKASSI